MNALIVVLPETIVRAICRTLVYSLYWGVVAAAITGMMLLATKKLRSSVRYFFLVGIMGLFVITTVVTFYKQLAIHSSPGSLPAATISAVSSVELQVASSSVDPGQTSIADAISLFCNQHSAVIVSIWLLVIAFRCVRMMVDWRRVHFLTKRQIAEPGNLWNDRIVKLSEQLRVSVPVRLLQSGIVKVPVTLGHLKPIILVPIGILTAMPQDQVEAVLLHELAHIRRRDYFVNILQRFIEIFFFFNPAVLWISSLIKEERENCCDDIVISQTDNRGEYVNALVAFQEYTFGLSSIAPAFAGKNGHLLARVKRILYNTNKTMDGGEKMFLIAGMAIAGFFFLSSLIGRDQVPVKNNAMVSHPKEIAAVMPVLMDTLPTGHVKRATAAKPIIEVTVDGKHYKFVEENNTVTELYVDGKRIPDGNLAEYQSLALVTQLLPTVPGNARAQKMLRDMQQANAGQRDQLLAMKMNADNAYKALNADTLAFNEVNLMLSKENADRVLELEKLQANLALEKAQANHAWADEQANRALEKAREDQLLEKAQVNLLLEKMNRQGNKLFGREGNSLEQYIDPIVEDLIQDKVINKKDSDNFSFELNNDGLTVNGVRQPEELFIKYKEKYVKNPKDYFSYTVKDKTKKMISVSVN
jgi:beta-lactamase regulating signal transducer with metallopeptidase domain